MKDEANWDDVDFGHGRDPIADAIGSLIVNFAYFNSCLDGAVSLILGLDVEQARILVVPMQPREKTKILRGYAQARLGDEYKRVAKELCKRADELIDYRNKISHGHLVRPNPEGNMQLWDYSGKGRFQPRVLALSVEDVAHNSVCTLRLGKDIQSFAHDLNTVKPERD